MRIPTPPVPRRLPVSRCLHARRARRAIVPWLAALAVAAAFAGCAPSSEDAEPVASTAGGTDEFLDPVIVDGDHYALEFENEYVRVLREHLPAGVEGAMHSHRDRVSVYLNGADVTITPRVGEPVRVTLVEGSTSWGDATTHRGLAHGDLENVSIELRELDGAAIAVPGPDAVEVDPEHHVVDFENDRVRVVRMTYPPGYATPLHAHRRGFGVFLTDATGRNVPADGEAVPIEAEARSSFWTTGAPAHVTENHGDGDLVVVLVEMKREPTPEMSLIGTPITPVAFTAEVRARLEQDLAIARAQMAVAPEREDSFIWVGRRLGYLGRYAEAIDVFTRGLELYPDSYKLLRYRGRHRARSRDFEGAIADYRRAAELVEDQPDTFEPDGIPNAIERPITTYRSNIHYYLGQTSMAVGDYETVISAMERAASEPLGQSADRIVSTAYWRYLAHMKLGQEEAARRVVDAVPDDLEVIENVTYYDSVLFFKGTKTREELEPDADNLVKYAFAMRHHFDGEQAEAEAIWRELVVETPLGYWPAEAELVMARDR